MKLRFLDGIALTLWVGSLWSIGYLAVPVLFQAQPDRQLAGSLAGEMFGLQGWIALVCGSYLLLRCAARFGRLTLREPAFLNLALMLVLSLVIQFGIQPLMNGLKSQALPLAVMQSPYADTFAMWHGTSSILYLIESLLGLAAIYFHTRPTLPRS
jgi:hypothetical protein